MLGILENVAMGMYINKDMYIYGITSVLLG
jgi:hypothetical protein